MLDTHASVPVRGGAPTPGTDFKSVSAPPGARGVALITVLLVLAILTAIVGRLSFSNQVWIRQVGNGADFLQSALAVRAVQDWAGLILDEDDRAYDSFQDAWAQPPAPLPVGRGFVRGYGEGMEDMQARINLNNLVQENRVNAQARKTLEQLLRILELNPGIAAAIVDWMDTGGDVYGPWGAEDGYYLGMNPPYVAANKPLDDPAELRLVRGVGRKVWYKLRPYVSALPPDVKKININTASREVLAAVLTSLGQAQAHALIKAEQLRGKARQEPFKSQKDIQNYCKMEQLTPDCETLKQLLDVKTEFFLAHTLVETGNARRRTATLYKRAGDGVSVRGHWREYD